jgi:hypothetical protein
MTTLISVYNSEGLVGRCDAKCYNAHDPDCDCICGGRNHRAGLQQALDNTADLVDPDGELRRQFAEARGLDAAALSVQAPLTLF